MSSQCPGAPGCTGNCIAYAATVHVMPLAIERIRLTCNVGPHIVRSDFAIFCSLFAYAALVLNFGRRTQVCDGSDSYDAAFATCARTVVNRLRTRLLPTIHLTGIGMLLYTNRHAVSNALGSLASLATLMPLFFKISLIRSVDIIAVSSRSQGARRAVETNS
jgi:hypothetical protein